MIRRLVLLAMLSPLLVALPQVSPLAKTEWFVDDWDEGDENMPDRSKWADYYAKNAHVRLGPERRLRNGISWRLLVDNVTGIGMPRITWMPDVHRLRTANRLLDTVHGGAMLFAVEREQYLRRLNESALRAGDPVIEAKYAIVQEAAVLTYASVNFVSLIDLEYMVAGGNELPRIIRGLTFDLRRERIFKVEACPGKVGDYADRHRLFRFGDLLDFCYPGSEHLFVSLVQKASDRAVAASANSTDAFVQQCRRGRVVPDITEYVLYLTFDGLAVQITSYGPNSDKGCALMFNALNPVIIPYRDLEHFMKSGPLRDELLR